jgi:hypothetical protein
MIISMFFMRSPQLLDVGARSSVAPGSTGAGKPFGRGAVDCERRLVADPREPAGLHTFLAAQA